jgi:D-3-phosphoglycerate dehydrogenase
MAVPNHLVKGHNGMVAGDWLKKELKRTELYGKTLCLVGMGNIAIEVAKRAAAFGMTVKAYRQSGKPSEYADVKATLKEALEGADYVSMHTPLTPETSGMFNQETIGWMKDGAVLVNTGRGKCVVAEDVVAALESGKLSGYATDVWPSDPPAPDYPILKAPNVVMLPHLGASTKENLLRIGEEVEAIIAELQEGGQL